MAIEVPGREPGDPLYKMKRRQSEEAPIPEEIKRSRLQPSPKESPLDQYQRRRKWRSWSVEEVSAFLLANDFPEDVARKFERELLFSACINNQQSVSFVKRQVHAILFGGGLATGVQDGELPQFSHLTYITVGHQIAGRHLLDLTNEDLEKMEIS